jgi:hypothetical protein
MLNDHLLALTFQVSTGLTGSFSFNDVAWEAAYLNMARRWNWGVESSQVPYVAGTVQSVLTTTPDGELVESDRQITYRQVQRGASGVVAFPFDRLRRVEFRGGVARTSFEQFVTTTTVHQSGTIDSAVTVTLQSPSLNLATGSVAFVSDSTVFGPAGPLQGERYRLEVAPALGSINFAGVLMDYRRYIMPAQFYTIATRVLHYGRYGSGSDDPRLAPVFLDSPWFVRGYESLDYAKDCVVTSTSSCALAERFPGSRILVGNIELRLPLLRPFGVSPRMYGPVPVELVVFGDTGVAWTKVERPTLLGGTRQGISSAGVGARIALGPLAAEFDLSRPFQRPQSGWVFGFNLIPVW